MILGIMGSRDLPIHYEQFATLTAQLLKSVYTDIAL